LNISATGIIEFTTINKKDNREPFNILLPTATLDMSSTMLKVKI